MKEAKGKRLYTVATFEPMYNAPKVLSNEGKAGKDISSSYTPWDGGTVNKCLVIGIERWNEERIEKILKDQSIAINQSDSIQTWQLATICNNGAATIETLILEWWNVRRTVRYHLGEMTETKIS